MKYLIIALLLTAFLAPSSVDAATRVNGYYRSNGTYVQPYHRSSPNSSKIDNYSTKGNYNPYSGKRGTRSYYGW